jgi:membrane-associated protease RseP (regulator of RpoE activity)
MSRSTLAALLIVPLFAAQPAAAAEPAEPDAVIDLNLAGLSLNTAVESLSAQSGAVFVVAANPQELGPNIQLTGVPLAKAINIIATAYGVCTEARPPVTSFRYCNSRFARRGQAPLAARKSTRGAALLGVEIIAGTPRDPSAARSPGAVVLRVLAGSVASAAGLLPGDAILSVDGRIVGTPLELRDAVDAVQLGTPVTLEISRNGRRESLTAQF